jgi:hypothetical protein
MPDILRRQIFTFEDMPQMRFAFCALDFDALSVGVRNVLDCARNLIVKTRPSAPANKLVVRPI